MNLSDVPKFDPDAHTPKELRDLQALADSCTEATTADEIETAGNALDRARAKRRHDTRSAAARSRSLNAVHKVLIHEVPRRTNIDGEMIPVPERKPGA